VAEVMGAVEVDDIQERVAWGWERRPADLVVIGHGLAVDRLALGRPTTPPAISKALEAFEG
jgi:hypothetical protein